MSAEAGHGHKNQGGEEGGIGGPPGLILDVLKELASVGTGIGDVFRGHESGHGDVHDAGGNTAEGDHDKHPTIKPPDAGHGTTPGDGKPAPKEPSHNSPAGEHVTPTHTAPPTTH